MGRSNVKLLLGFAFETVLNQSLNDMGHSGYSLLDSVIYLFNDRFFVKIMVVDLKNEVPEFFCKLPYM